MLLPSLITVLALLTIYLSINCDKEIGDNLTTCNHARLIILSMMAILTPLFFAVIRGIVMISENRKKKMLLHDKVTTISDDDKITFNALWANHLLKEWQNVEDDRPLQDFIMYMARTYSFDCTNFQLVDKERNLVHMRIPRI